MLNSPVRLGSIDLQDFEIPQSLRFGGRYRLAVHTLAGGRRSVERLGPDDSEIQFRGTFSGPAAEARARAFDTLRLSGEIVSLTWEAFRRQVIVKSFIADYHSPWWIPYQVSCVVVHQTRVAPSMGTNAAAMLSLDVSNAISAAAGTTISLTSLQGVLSGANTLTTGTADQAQATAIVGSTLRVINDQVDRESMQLSTPIPSDRGMAYIGQSFVSKVDCAASLAAAVNVASYVGRIGVTIGGSSE